MTFPSTADTIVIAFFLTLLVLAAAIDVRRHRTPNWICLGVAVLYLAHVFVAAQPVDWGGGVVAAGMTYLVAAAAFARKQVGGRIKVLTATALWAGPAGVVPFLLVSASVGAALGLARIAGLPFARPRRYAIVIGSGARVPLRKHGLPYGVALAVGGVYVASRLMTA